MDEVCGGRRQRSKPGPCRVEREAPGTIRVSLAYGPSIQVRIATRSRSGGATDRMVRRYFDRCGCLVGDPARRVPALVEEVGRLRAGQKARIRIDPEVVGHAKMLEETRVREEERRWFREEVAAGRRSLEVLGAKLAPYQEEGVLHLAFAGRAILADELGLGRTMQAIAAALLVKELKGISRVLVVAPAAREHHWLREIRRLTSVSATMVDDGPAGREMLHTAPAFFTIVAHERWLRDTGLFERLAPDLVVFDEAHRVGPWRTRVAPAIQRLGCRWLFVLTGTPLDSDLEELHGMLQAIDPRILGPLPVLGTRVFQLRRDGGVARLAGGTDQDELYRRIRPVALERAREEVLAELPQRGTCDYFVPMPSAQAGPYRKPRAIAAQLMAIGERRPLTPVESRRLVRSLQKMRGLCCAPELHGASGPGSRSRPGGSKLDELRSLLTELVTRRARKVAVFSSSERMIDLAVERVVRPLGVGFTKIAGAVAKPRVDGLLDRFHHDPACLVQLATDVSGPALELEAVNFVVNLDLPWSPESLERRIRSAHRPGHRGSVTVINLVSRDVLEERILDTLSQRRQTFQTVLDALDGADDLVFSRDRGLVARLQQLLMPGAAPRRPLADDGADRPAAGAGTVPLEERVRLFADRLAGRLGQRLLLVRRVTVFAGHDGQSGDLPRVLVVVDRDAGSLAAIIDEVASSVAGAPPAFGIHLFDRQGYDGLAGLLGPALTRRDRPADEPYRSPALPLPEGHDGGEGRQRLQALRELLERAQKRLGLASLVACNGFAADAAAPLRQALDLALEGLLALVGVGAGTGRVTPLAIEHHLVRSGVLTAEEATRASWVLGVLDAPADGSSPLDRPLVDGLVKAIERLLAAGRVSLSVRALGGSSASRPGPVRCVTARDRRLH
ncbi:MAG: DEAD/DEAH box helicase [Candidatus Riflebacteria bacterium]|nr:DEAD/DEAH box helicase [Candidatus Riflebacteria bacterium]